MLDKFYENKDKFINLFNHPSINNTMGKKEVTLIDSPVYQVQDLEALNERIGKGDKSALKELEQKGIPYAIKEDDNGFTVNYSYNGNNYTIVYISPNSQNNEIQNPEIPQEETLDTVEEQPEKNDVSSEILPNLENSDINVDANAADFYNSNKISENELKTSLGTKSFVDYGGWDSLFQELEKIKPQLLDYIKMKVEEKGLTFDKEKAEKYIEVYMTRAVELIPIEGQDVKINFNEVRLPKEPTIGDIINYIKERIDKEVDLTNKDSILELFNKNNLYHAFSEEEINNFTDLDKYLLYTADYFLTDEEKEMKFVMKLMANESSYSVSSKDQLLDYINTYAKHVKKVLIAQYENLTEMQIDEIIKKAVNLINNSVKPSEEGFYCVYDSLTMLEHLCIAAAEKDIK